MDDCNAKLYRRMPAHFGPTPGPRQGPDGKPFDLTVMPHRISASVTFRTDAKLLEGLLPPNFSLWAEPLVTVEVQYLTQLEWLAGRGYNLLGVRFPASFNGKQDKVNGSFLAVLWENLAEPIISGREELGYNKIWCEIPPPRELPGRRIYNGCWLGHTFLELSLSDLKPIPVQQAAIPGPSGSAGLLHYKYIPRTGRPGEADVEYATLSPAQGSKAKVVQAWIGAGTVEFKPTTWDQMPTQFHIVNALAVLPVNEVVDARVVETMGGKDLGDQRRLD